MLAPLLREGGLIWMCCVAEPVEAAGSREALMAVASAVSGAMRLDPIPIPKDVYNRYYNGMSNEALWMLQHRLLGASGLPAHIIEGNGIWEDGYLRANQLIAEAAVHSHPNARAFLVHDYHLYLLPALLRRARPDAPILHFTHIPFPGPSEWQHAPAAWTTAILRGMLGADVVGFQTTKDVEAFLACCQQFLGLSTESDLTAPRGGGIVSSDGRRTVVRAYPASVDPTALLREMRLDSVTKARDRLSRYDGYRLIVRADRLDPAKNQLAGFQAYGRLLETRPDVRKTTRFLAVLSPSRTDLAAYRAYGAAVVQAVEEINSRFEDACGGPPIVLHLENDRAFALAAIERCDVLFANSIADGMNLVPKEWAVITNRDGMAVISETAGVAASTADTALLIPPHDVERTALALGAALDMPQAERARRLAAFRRQIDTWTSRDWLSAQLADLEGATTSTATTRAGGSRLERHSVPSRSP